MTTNQAMKGREVCNITTIKLNSCMESGRIKQQGMTIKLRKSDNQKNYIRETKIKR